MVVHDLFMAAQPRGGSPARAHGHEVLVEVTGADAVHEYHAQQVLEVCRHFVRQVEGTVLFIDRLAAIERRMGRHEAEAHPAAVERTGGVVAGAPRQVAVPHEMYVAVHGIHVRVRHCLGHALQHIVGSIKIVRVEDAHHVAHGHADALVHCVINALVQFADPAQAAAVKRLVFPHDGKRIVLGAAINHDVLEVAEILPQHAFQRVTESSTAVVSSGDDRYGHKIIGINRGMNFKKGIPLNPLICVLICVALFHYFPLSDFHCGISLIN